LDADDAIEPEFIGVCVRELEQDRSLGIAYTKIRAINSEGQSEVSKWPGEFDYDAQLRRRNQIPTACVFRREAWARVGGYRSRYCPKGAGSEDAQFWTAIGSIGYGAKLATTEPLFIYSLGTGRVTGDPEYREVDWLSWFPWVQDQQHPFASIATPQRKWSHAVRQYDEPLVSVVIPVGPGHEKEVTNALDSLDAQTFRKWEVIVVADGTSIPKEIRKAYPYVMWLALAENSGAGAARNLGAMFARASFLVFLDADDWFYPDALMRMLQAWNVDEAIIYTDYVGKSTVKDPDELIPSLKEKLYQWDEETGEAIIGYRSADYDCKLAQKQPEHTGNAEMPFYLWCNVTCLIPKAWHEEIGGFDESMKSWEDVDYHWRMARAGKCYVRLAEELMVYCFNTGLRRQEGLQSYPKIVEYLEDKYKEIETIMCNCGGGRSSIGKKSSPVAQSVGRVAGAIQAQPQKGNTQVSDQDFVRIKYIHPNQGTHGVTGSHIFPAPLDIAGMRLGMKNVGDGFKIDYHYRKGGETFLVHKLDAQAAPHIFQEIQTAEGGVFNPPQPAAQPTPTPEVIVREARVPVAQLDELDLQLLPGISNVNARQLEADGITTKSQVLELGVPGLKKYPGIGEIRAKAIIDAINHMG
jgi:glycosyltransferase involved in cell wall biosynthesis